VTALADLRKALDQLLGVPPHINGTHLSAIDPLLNRDATLQLLTELLADEGALAEIAARSYTHSLGFKKITILEPLIELPGGGTSTYQVRLHLWLPTNKSVPLVESKHEHSFDFISRLLVGEMENQCYRQQALTPDQTALCERLQIRLTALSEQDHAYVEQAVQGLETVRLSALGSLQAVKENVSVDRAKLRQLLQLTDAELDELVGFQGRYEYDVTASTFGGNYVHRLTGMVNLVPSAVLKLRAGDLYHHPHPYVHRLFIPNQANATIIVTTPLTPNVQGASFQHPTWFAGRNANYPRQMYTVPDLIEAIASFKGVLEAEGASKNGRLLDVDISAKQ
jgi:hypothetical protein